MVGFASTGSSRARRAAFGLAAFSMAAFGSTAAFAKEPIAPACLSAGGEIAQLRCSIKASKKATAQFDARTAAAEARIAESKRASADAKKISAAALASTACIDGLKRELQTAISRGPLKPEQVRLFGERAQHCQRT